MDSAPRGARARDGPPSEINATVGREQPAPGSGAPPAGAGAGASAASAGGGARAAPAAEASGAASPAARGVDVVFVNVSYSVPDRRQARSGAPWGGLHCCARCCARGCSLCRPSAPEPPSGGRAGQRAPSTGRFDILRDVTGYFRAGEVAAVMGSSGCGKTTLLDVLSGRVTAGQRSGAVLLGGRPRAKGWVRRNVAYVEQFDKLLPQLTPAETLLYTAELKRSALESKAIKRAAVERVITTLRLQGCRNVLVGDPLTKGISGGQAKRLAIGLTLVSEPRVLFLDEPTTGLDSSLANEVATALRDVAETFKAAVCATVHAPTSYVFGSFDRILLLGANTGGDANAAPAGLATHTNGNNDGAALRQEATLALLPDFRDRGRVLYFGPLGEGGSAVRAFLERQGYAFPAHPGALSTAEWMGDIIGEKAEDNAEDAQRCEEAEGRAGTLGGGAEGSSDDSAIVVKSAEGDTLGLAGADACFKPQSGGKGHGARRRRLNLAAFFATSPERAAMRRDICGILSSYGLDVYVTDGSGGNSGGTGELGVEASAATALRLDDGDMVDAVAAAQASLQVEHHRAAGANGRNVAASGLTKAGSVIGVGWRGLRAAIAAVSLPGGKSGGNRSDVSSGEPDGGKEAARVLGEYRQVSQVRALAVLMRYRGVRNLTSVKWVMPRTGDKIIFALVTMSLFWGVASREDSASVQSTVAVLFQLVALTAFTAAIYVTQLFLERPVFYRERADGLYNTGTYLAYNLIMEFGWAALTSVIFVCIVFWSIGFDERGNFGVFWLIYYLMNLTSISAAYLAAAAMPALELANALLPIYMAFSLYFAGFLLPLPQVPQGWQWYTYINPLRWAFTSWLLEQYEGTDFVVIDGQTVLDYYGGVDESLALNCFYLFLFPLVFVILALLALSFIQHGSR